MKYSVLSYNNIMYDLDAEEGPRSLDTELFALDDGEEKESIEIRLAGTSQTLATFAFGPERRSITVADIICLVREEFRARGSTRILVERARLEGGQVVVDWSVSSKRADKILAKIDAFISSSRK